MGLVVADTLLSPLAATGTKLGDASTSMVNWTPLSLRVTVANHGEVQIAAVFVDSPTETHPNGTAALVPLLNKRLSVLVDVGKRKTLDLPCVDTPLPLDGTLSESANGQVVIYAMGTGTTNCTVHLQWTCRFTRSSQDYTAGRLVRAPAANYDQLDLGPSTSSDSPA